MSTTFEPGAPAAEGFVPLCAPYLAGKEWDYVKDCLDTGWVSSAGSYVERFEHDLAAYVDTKYAIATSSGTAALQVALLVAGVQPDDEVLVSDLTFVAPANAARYIGAFPVFMDVDPLYWEMDVQKVADFLRDECVYANGALRNKVTQRRIRALLPVHVLGHPTDMTPLLGLAKRYELKVVVDATESLGTLYKDRPVGIWGDIVCYSFNGNKIMTTGSGGMIVTDDEVWAKRAKYLTTQAKDDPVEYVHEEIGYNYRLSNIQAAIGCAQLEQMPQFVARKRQIAARYSAAFADSPGISPMQEAPYAFSTFWMYTVRIDAARYGLDSRALMRKLQQARIQSRPLWRPLHRLTPHKISPVYRIEVANRLYEEALSLPCSVGLTNAEQERVIAAVRD